MVRTLDYTSFVSRTHGDVIEYESQFDITTEHSCEQMQFENPGTPSEVKVAINDFISYTPLTKFLYDSGSGL